MLFRVDPSSNGRQNNFNRIVSHESTPIFYEAYKAQTMRIQFACHLFCLCSDGASYLFELNKAKSLSSCRAETACRLLEG